MDALKPLLISVILCKRRFALGMMIISSVINRLGRSGRRNLIAATIISFLQEAALARISMGMVSGKLSANRRNVQP